MLQAKCVEVDSVEADPFISARFQFDLVNLLLDLREAFLVAQKIDDLCVCDELAVRVMAQKLDR